jgi:hypothetical protein
MIFEEQAESCRRQAAEYAGRPEAPFLLNVARAFEELGDTGSSSAFAQIRGKGMRVPRESIPA